MKLAVEVFGKGMEIEAGWGVFSLRLGHLLDVLYDPATVTRGRRWLDWLSHDTRHLEVWLGHRHIGIDWGSTWERHNATGTA